MIRSTKTILSLILCITLVALAVPTAFAIENNNITEIELSDGTYVPNEVMVMFKNDAIKDSDMSLDNARDLDHVDPDYGSLMSGTGEDDVAAKDAQSEVGIIRNSLGDSFTLMDSVSFDETLTIARISSDTLDTKTMIERLSKNENIISAEANYYCTQKSYDYSLDDALNYYNYQANQPSAQNTAGDSVNSRGFDKDGLLSTNAGDAWNRLTGNEDEVVVAVVDSGINENHEDLKNMLWTNPGDIGLSGEHGFNFYENSDSINDNIGHGTHCSGIIAAEADNEVGISGVASKANIKIMMCSTAESQQYPNNEAISYREIGAFNYILKAKERGVNIVATSNSWGAAGKSTIYDYMFDRLGEAGILNFVAAGNENENLDHTPFSPGGGNSEYMITVGAANIDGSRAGFSSYGRTKVDLFAPGANILSTVGYTTYFPNIQTQEVRSETTEYYGLFDKTTIIEQDGVTPSVTDCDQSVKSFGKSVFHEQNTDPGAEPAYCEFSLVDDYNFTKCEKPASLKVTVKNAKCNASYYLYFPYQKNPLTDGNKNTDFSLVMTREHYDGDLNFGIAGGDVLIDENGDCSIYNNGYFGAESTIKDSKMMVHMRQANEPRVLIAGADSLDGKNTGIGLCFTPYSKTGESSGEFHFYLDSIAVSRPDAEIERDSSYEIMSGTSMATPAAAGAYAVLASLYPIEENQDPAKYALINKARLMASVTKTEQLEDLCVSGGYIDLTKVDNVLPEIQKIECDVKNDDLIIRGQNLYGGYTLYAKNLAHEGEQYTALPRENETVTFSEDGKTIIIHSGSAFFNTYTEFILKKDGAVLTKFSDFIVKGQDHLEKVYEEIYPKTMDDNYFLLEDRYLLTDSKGQKLYSYSNSTGVLYRYDGNNFNACRSLDLNETFLDIFRKEGYDEYELRHNFTTELVSTPAALYTNDKLYQFVKVTYSPVSDNEGEGKEYFYLCTMDYTSENPKWNIKETKTFSEAFDMEFVGDLSFTAMNGKIYCAGGEYFDDPNKEPVPFMFCYDPENDTWEQKESLPKTKAELIMKSKNGKIYAAFGQDHVIIDGKPGMKLSTEVYCYDSDTWTKLSDIPYVDINPDKDPTVMTRPSGTCAIIKEGLLFYDCSVEGAGNVFIYRFDTKECEPLFYTTNEYFNHRLLLYSAVETKDGIYFFQENTDGYLRYYDMYLLPSDSGKYDPDYQNGYIRGDADCDRTVTITDVTQIQKHLANIEADPFDEKAADVDSKGLDIADVTYIQQYLAKIDNPYDIGEEVFS